MSQENKPTKRKAESSPETNWANAFTLSQLREQAEGFKLSVPAIATKIEIVRIMVKGGFERPKTSRAKKSKNGGIVDLATKIVESLGEATEIELVKSPIANGWEIRDTGLIVNSNHEVIGNLKDGQLVLLDRANVDYAVGQRISVDNLAIERKPATLGTVIDLDSDDDDDGSNDVE